MSLDADVTPDGTDDLAGLEFSDVIVPDTGDTTDAVPADDLPAGNAKESAADRVRRRLLNGWGGEREETDAPSPAEESTPRRSTRSKSAKAAPKVVPPKPREGALVKPLTQMYVSVGTLMLPFDPNCSAAIINNAENCAKSLEALARENEAVRRAIIALTQTSAWGGVLIAHLPILLMVLVHHAPKQVAEAAAPMASLMNGGAFDNLGQDDAEDTAA